MIICLPFSSPLPIRTLTPPRSRGLPPEGPRPVFVHIAYQDQTHRRFPGDEGGTTCTRRRAAPSAPADDAVDRRDWMLSARRLGRSVPDQARISVFLERSYCCAFHAPGAWVCWARLIPWPRGVHTYGMCRKTPRSRTLLETRTRPITSPSYAVAAHIFPCEMLCTCNRLVEELARR